MKQLRDIFGELLLVVASGLLMTACSNDDENNKKISIAEAVIRPIEAPVFNAYSGGRLKNIDFGVKGVNRAADVNGNLWYQNWIRPTNVTESERVKVVEEFSKKREGVKNTLQVTWENFWVQQVYKGETAYTDGFGQDIGVASNKMNHLLVFNTLKEEVVSWWPYEVRYTEYEGGYEHINNFNSGDNQTVYTDDETHEQYIGTTLMTHFKSDGRDEQFGYHNSVDSKDHYEYVILEIDGAWYVGFDFYATHPEGQDANKNMDVERDWVFNDWIVKVCPARMIGEEFVPPVFPDPNEEISGDMAASVQGHVEINLSMNAEREKDDYIASKLSIHVRDTTDVEIFIPVPAEYYCAADDMYIVVSHKEEIEAHGPTSESMEFEVNGQKVSISVAFELGGVRIKTVGTNREVLRYLRTNYGDGITFEVWNYYNSTATRKVVKEFLDKSTVSFTHDPGQYINAFALLNGTINPLDCTVAPPAVFGNKTINDGTAVGNYNVTYTKR